MSVDIGRVAGQTGDLKEVSALRRIKQVRGQALAAGAALLLSLILPLPDAAGQILHLPSVCPFYHLTGLPCPGCGLTRAFVLIGHGDWRQSLTYHPVGWLAYAAFLTMFLDGVPMLAGLRRRGLLPPIARSRILWVCLAVVLVVGLIRLISWAAGGHRSF